VERTDSNPVARVLGTSRSDTVQEQSRSNDGGLHYLSGILLVVKDIVRTSTRVFYEQKDPQEPVELCFGVVAGLEFWIRQDMFDVFILQPGSVEASYHRLP